MAYLALFLTIDTCFYNLIYVARIAQIAQQTHVPTIVFFNVVSLYFAVAFFH